jgi:DNA-binding MarR family transcriptional regulator
MARQSDLSDHSLSVLISILDRVIDDAVEAGLDAAGYPDVRRAHDPVFEMVDQGGTRITDMAARARMTKQGMGQLVSHLEERGYVARRPDPDDGRAKLVALTEKGEEAVTAATAALTNLEARWATHLGERRARELRAALVDLCLAFGREHIR